MRRKVLGLMQIAVVALAVLSASGSAPAMAAAPAHEYTVSAYSVHVTGGGCLVGFTVSWSHATERINYLDIRWSGADTRTTSEGSGPYTFKAGRTGSTTLYDTVSSTYGFETLLVNFDDFNNRTQDVTTAGSDQDTVYYNSSCALVTP